MTDATTKYDLEEVVSDADIEKWHWEDNELVDHRERVLATLSQPSQVEIHFPARAWTALAGSFNHVQYLSIPHTQDPRSFIQREIADAARVAASGNAPIQLNDTVAEFGEERMDGLSLLYMLEQALGTATPGDEPFQNLPNLGRQALAAILAETVWRDSAIMTHIYDRVKQHVAASVNDPAVRAILDSGR